MKIFCGFLLISFFCSIRQTASLVSVIGGTSDIYEGDKLIFRVRFDASDTCQINHPSMASVADTNDYSLTGDMDGQAINMASFAVAHQTATLTLSAFVDSDANELLTIDIFCQEINLHTNIDVNILASAGGNGDPHFNQYIFNRLTNDTTRICYDATVQPNQFIHVFSQSKLETELYGQLKDDYYMHKIIFKYQNLIVRADVFKISFLSSSSQLNFTWNEIIHKDWSDFHGLLFRQTTKMIEIRRSKDDNLSFGIMRRKDLYGKYFLDVSVIGLAMNYTGIDGLLGRIGNNKISVYPQVQAPEISGRVTVLVNELKTFGYERLRNNESCTLVQVDDLLFPRKLSDYVLESNEVKF